MKIRWRIIAAVFLAIMSVAIVVVFLCPPVVATRYSYFDTNNGRLKVQCVSFGRVYRESIEDSKYSKLLKDYGYEELPAEWKRANAEELGVRRLFYAQKVSYNYGQVAADAKVFATFLELKKLQDNEAREQISRFRALLQKGTPTEVRQYVESLQQMRIK
jgi:hypothetical protein